MCIRDSPNYTASVQLEPEARAALALDLTGGSDPLMDFSEVAPLAAGAPTILVSRGRVRAVVPARPLAAAHVVVETVEPCGPYPDLAPDVVAELQTLAKELAREMIRTHGRCRISVDATATPARIDVYAPPA